MEIPNSSVDRKEKFEPRSQSSLVLRKRYGNYYYDYKL